MSGSDSSWLTGLHVTRRKPTPPAMPLTRASRPHGHLTQDGSTEMMAGGPPLSELSVRGLRERRTPGVMNSGGPPMVG
jgi:hypothetical protein